MINIYEFFDTKIIQELGIIIDDYSNKKK